MPWSCIKQTLIHWSILALVIFLMGSPAEAITLGSPVMLSKPGEPLKAEIPLRMSAQDQSNLDALSIEPISKIDYERLGISPRILEFKPTISLRKVSPSQGMITVESGDAIDTSKDPFVDLIVGLKWANGAIAKTYSLMVGDVSKVLVKPGQSLSEIASQISPQLGGADMDEALLALYKANPDAFIGGSIHRLMAGAELNKPSPSLLRSITPSEAKEFAIEANRLWLEQQVQNGGNQIASKTSNPVSKKPVGTGEDRLKIGPGTGSEADTRRYVEELVAQEKALSQSKARVAELEKNITDLQRLLDARKETGANSLEGNPLAPAAAKTAFEQWAPAAVGLGLIALTSLLLWSLARYTRRAETESNPVITESLTLQTDGVIPAKAAAILSSLDLNLGSNKQSEPMPAAEALRVKLNLVRAYITIEDFIAARKGLEEILLVSNQVDPQITIAAHGLLSELNQRSDL